MNTETHECAQTTPPVLANSGEGWRMIRFAALWLGLLLLIKILIVPLVKHFMGHWICGLEARHCAALANLVGMDATLQGNEVATPDFSILIWFACTGTDYMLYLAGLAALFPGRIRYRWLWVIGLPLVLYAVVQVRLLLFLIIGGRWPDAVPFLHDSWNSGFVILFCLFWLAFLWMQMRWGAFTKQSATANQAKA